MKKTINLPTLLLLISFITANLLASKGAQAGPTNDTALQQLDCYEQSTDAEAKLIKAKDVYKKIDNEVSTCPNSPRFFKYMIPEDGKYALEIDVKSIDDNKIVTLNAGRGDQTLIRTTINHDLKTIHTFKQHEVISIDINFKTKKPVKYDPHAETSFFGETKLFVRLYKVK